MDGFNSKYRKSYKYFLYEPLGVMRYKHYLDKKRNSSDAYKAFKEYHKDTNNEFNLLRSFGKKARLARKYERELKRDIKKVQKLKDKREKFRDLMRGEA